MNETFSWRGKFAKDLDRDELLQVIEYLLNRVKEAELTARKIERLKR